MEFRKIIKIPKANFEISHQDKIVFLGSCFSEHIGNHLKEHRFDLFQNPQGIIFNPIALANVFEPFQEQEILKKESGFSSWFTHSSINELEEQNLKNKLISIKKETQEVFKHTNYAFVTFGSAWGYEHQDLKSIVANCHKAPQQIFTKKLSSVEVIVNTWREIIARYPHVEWVFTVSPVRHWKDGVRENNVSKGVLHQAIHELLDLDNVSYFPSYEILLDELRDYRFYKDDFLHPNELAISYIWERFQETFFSKSTQNLVQLVAQYNKMKQHKVMQENTSEASVFNEKIKTLEKELKQVGLEI